MPGAVPGSKRGHATMTNIGRIIYAPARHIRAGETILGRREHHVTVESVTYGVKSVTVRGVNGWGEAVTMRYQREAQVGVLLPA